MKTIYTILDSTEFNKFKSRIPQISGWWWLRDPGLNPNTVKTVMVQNRINQNGEDPKSMYGTLRPVLISDEEIPQKNNQRYYRYNNTDWIFLGKYKGMLYYITRTDIGKYRFDKFGNNFETSELSKVLGLWTEYMKQTNGSLSGFSQKVENWREVTISPIDNKPLSDGLTDETRAIY